MTVKSNANRAISHFQRDYQIIGKLRSGGMGRVYLAIMNGPLNTQQKVVLKLPLSLRDAARVKRDFENEARVMAQLNHPNIIRVIEWTEMNGAPCMVCELIEGFELRDIIRLYRSNSQWIPLQIVAQIMLQACEAMQYVHTAKAMDGTPLHIVHRDIDASNIMVTDGGFVKVIDFGIARNVMQESLTEPGVYKGRMINMSPDVFLYSEVDHRADIFSMGILLYELLTGVRPRQFGATDSITRMIENIRTQEIPRPSDAAPHVPDVFDRIVSRATQLNRENRYQSAAEMFNDLRAVSRTLAAGPSHMSVRKWVLNELAVLRKERDDRIQKALALPSGIPDFPGERGMRRRRHHSPARWQIALANHWDAMRRAFRQTLRGHRPHLALKAVSLAVVFAAAAVTTFSTGVIGAHPSQKSTSVQVETVTEFIVLDDQQDRSSSPVIPRRQTPASADPDSGDDVVNSPVDSTLSLWDVLRHTHHTPLHTHPSPAVAGAGEIE